MEEKAKELAELLKVLANENRLMILCHLIGRAMNVTELHERIGQISQSALSQHLALLKAHRILDCKKCGQSTVYFILDTKILDVMQMLKQVYCAVPQTEEK